MKELLGNIAIKLDRATVMSCAIAASVCNMGVATIFTTFISSTTWQFYNLKADYYQIYFYFMIPLLLILIGVGQYASAKLPKAGKDIFMWNAVKWHGYTSWALVLAFAAAIVYTVSLDCYYSPVSAVPDLLINNIAAQVIAGFTLTLCVLLRHTDDLSVPFKNAQEEIYGSGGEDVKLPTKADIGLLFDDKVYLDSVIAAGNRIRASIYSLAILSALLLITTSNSLGLNWNGDRVDKVATAYAWALAVDNSMPKTPKESDYQKQLNKAVGVPEIVQSVEYTNHIVSGEFVVNADPVNVAALDQTAANSSTGTKAATDRKSLPPDLPHFLIAEEQYKAAYTSVVGKQVNSWAFSLPILGTSSDNNSVGLFTSLGLIAVLYVFKLHLSQWIRQARVAIRVGNLRGKEALEYVKRSAVLTGVYMPPGSRLVMTVLPSCVPFVAFLFYLYADVLSRYTTVTLLGPSLAAVFIAIQLLLLIPIAGLVADTGLLLHACHDYDNKPFNRRRS